MFDSHLTKLHSPMTKTVQEFFTQDELDFMKSLAIDYLWDWDEESEIGLSVLQKLKQV
jgi:hypothetical protein